LPFAISEEV